MASVPAKTRPGSHAAWWGSAVAALALLGIGLVLTLVIALGGDGAAGIFHERDVVWLFWANVAVALLLVLVLLLAGLRLAARLKRGKFGSRLLIKLAGIFALVGILPGLVIYGVSTQFALRSLEAWFDVKLASALDAGLALGKGTLDSLQADVAERAGVAAARLAEARGAVAALRLERLREQLGVAEIAVLSATGQVLVSAGGGVAIAPERPGAALLRQARNAPAAQVEGLDEDPSRARVRAVALLRSSEIGLTTTEDRFVLLVQPLPRSLVADALAVQAAQSEYQQRALSRTALRRIVIGTLTLAMVLSVFGAVLLAIVLGNQIVRPLLLLADGVREVAAGDLGPKPVFASHDELGGLTRSFASMTQQLADARADIEQRAQQLDAARTRLQTILDNLTAGVIVFDREGRIDTVNPGAERILREPLQSRAGHRLAEVPALAAFAQAVDRRFEQGRQLRAGPEEGEREQWQDTIELAVGAPGAGHEAAGEAQPSLTLLVRGAYLPGPAPLLVFDDITEVVSAQRARAWAEVARRVAHEIKNPLTPIQLSAERLQHKLQSRLEGSDRSLLERSVTTIVAQVQALKTLINEFRDYARLPAARPEPLDLNALVADVLALYGQAIEQGRLAWQPAEGLPSLQGDASQLRQVVHNLVGNALDAVQGRADGLVQVATELQRGDDGAPRAIRLLLTDNGPGFAEHVLRRAFEPYVTTKAKGTGLGLAVVRKIVEEHQARIRLANLHEGHRSDGAVAGARVSISFPLLPQLQAGPSTA
jgi:nitrogen fixation/metabolism regulation signal transduction histidine kinase